MFSNFVSSLKQFVAKTPQIQPVRFRYHAEQRAKGYKRRYGYEDRLARSGLLPHYSAKEVPKLEPLPIYK